MRPPHHREMTHSLQLDCKACSQQMEGYVDKYTFLGRWIFPKIVCVMTGRVG